MQCMSKFEYALFISIALVFMSGCGERRAEIKSSNNYSNNGVSFQYPGSWSVTGDLEDEGYRYIFVESPGDAISKIEIYPKGASFSLLEFVKLDIENLKSNMPKIFSLKGNGEISEAIMSVEGKTIAGYKYMFNLSVLGVNVPHVSEFYMFQSDTESAYINNQVAVEDLDKVKSGFIQIVRSFEVKNALTKLSNQLQSRNL